MKLKIKQPKIIVILGPTASGKSNLAVKIAKYISNQSRIKKFANIRKKISDRPEIYARAEIISADSRQIYKGLDIGSGKVPRDYNDVECHYIYKNVRHHLIDVASPKRTFTVVQYQKLAKKALKDILKRGKIPIICGGTGLYIDSLIYNYKFPEVPPQSKLRAKLDKLSTEKLFEKLQKFDPIRAQNIDKYNRRRLIRALEIILITKKTITPLKKETNQYRILKIGIKLPPEELKNKISKRIKKMLKNGLLDEIKKLRKQNISWKKIYNFGFEYKYPAIFLQKKISRDEMLQKMLVENYRYAKKQMTWFKKDKNIFWLENPLSSIDRRRLQLYLYRFLI